MHARKRTKAYIGTSGWHYRHWRDVFYPHELSTGEWLSYYADQLRCTEINNSFYHLPKPETLAQWVDDTPRDFTFAVKAWRVITHRKKLKDSAQFLETFLEAIQPLGNKTGPILFQLPPRWHCNVQRLRDFIALLPKGYRCTFEFRDHSWHQQAVYDVLREHNMAFCTYDLAGFQSPLITTADFAYIRLHGPSSEAYCGKYHPNTLRAWSRRIGEMRQQGLDVYLFFDNDQVGYAVQNALMLQKIIDEDSATG